MSKDNEKDICRCGHYRSNHRYGTCDAYLRYPTAFETNMCTCCGFELKERAK